MKRTFLILSIIFSSAIVSAQTDLISARSHSSAILSLDEADNFGLPSKSIDSIIYIGHGCIVEAAGFYYGRDTFCDHPLFVENEYDLKKLKELYPDYVVFVGFTKSEKKKLDQQNSMPWLLALIGMSYLLYLFFPRLQSKKNL